jgi:hypothetical protein
MTEKISAPAIERLSVPRRFVAPRALTNGETATLRAIADVLVPATDDEPGATDDPDFDTHLKRAVDARADAFESLVDLLAEIGEESGQPLAARLRAMAEKQPVLFQVTSAVVAGAWLLSPRVRERIGYPGQRRDPASFEQAANELADGLLDPVIERGYIYTPDGVS